MEVRGVRETVQEAGRALRHPQADPDGRAPEPHPGGYETGKHEGDVRAVSSAI